MPNSDIRPGQRFRSDVGSIWEVLRVAHIEIQPQHVVIVDVNDRTSSKIISESVLYEPHRYQPAT